MRTGYGNEGADMLFLAILDTEFLHTSQAVQIGH